MTHGESLVAFSAKHVKQFLRGRSLSTNGTRKLPWNLSVQMAGSAARLTAGKNEDTTKRWKTEGVPGKELVPFIEEYAERMEAALAKAQPLLSRLALRVVRRLDVDQIPEEQRIECLELAVKLLTISRRRRAEFRQLKALIEVMAEEAERRTRPGRPGGAQGVAIDE